MLYVLLLWSCVPTDNGSTMLHDVQLTLQHRPLLRLVPTDNGSTMLHDVQLTLQHRPLINSLGQKKTSTMTSTMTSTILGLLAVRQCAAFICFRISSCFVALYYYTCRLITASVVIGPTR